MDRLKFSHVMTIAFILYGLWLLSYYLFDFSSGVTSLGIIVITVIGFCLMSIVNQNVSDDGNGES